MSYLERAIVYPEHSDEPPTDTRTIRGTRYDVARLLFAEAKDRGVEVPLVVDLTDLAPASGTDPGEYTFDVGESYTVALKRLGFVERTRPWAT